MQSNHPIKRKPQPPSYLFRKTDYSFNKTPAKTYLAELKIQYQKGNLPLNKSIIGTIDFVLDAINGNQPVNINVLRYGVILDSEEKGNLVTKLLIEMGVQYNKSDLKTIQKINPSAAKLLDKYIYVANVKKARL